MPHDGVNEIAHIVHGVVVFLDDSVFGGFFVPAVQTEFPDDVLAFRRKVKSLFFQERSGVADSVKHAVVCFPDGEFIMPPDAFNEACRGRIDRYHSPIEVGFSVP